MARDERGQGAEWLAADGPGQAGRGRAVMGKARQGAHHGMAGKGTIVGRAGQGWARHGMDRQGMASAEKDKAPAPGKGEGSMRKQQRTTERKGV